MPNHEANPCADMTHRRIEMEELVRGFGFVEPIYPQYRNAQEEAQLFLQHGSQRRTRLRQPFVQQQQRPYDSIASLYSLPLILILPLLRMPLQLFLDLLLFIGHLLL